MSGGLPRRREHTHNTLAFTRPAGGRAGHECHSLTDSLSGHVLHCPNTLETTITHLACCTHILGFVRGPTEAAAGARPPPCRPAHGRLPHAVGAPLVARSARPHAPGQWSRRHHGQVTATWVVSSRIGRSKHRRAATESERAGLRASSWAPTQGLLALSRSALS